MDPQLVLLLLKTDIYIYYNKFITTTTTTTTTMFLLQGVKQTTDEIDDLMAGMKISVSFSCPSNLLMAIEDFRMQRFYNNSQAMCRLIRLGITYTKLLEEQRAEREAKPVVRAKKKKAKPKTPSKTK